MLHSASMQLSGALTGPHKTVAQTVLLPSPFKLGRASFNKPVVQQKRKQQRCKVGAHV